MYIRYDASISLPANFSESHGRISDTWQNSVQNPTFSWTAPPDLSGINKYYLYFGSDPGGSIPTDSTSNTSFGFTGSEGIFHFRIQVKDNAGNNSEWMTGFIFKYDNTNPTNPISVAEIGGTISDEWQGDVSDPNFNWSGAADLLSGIAQYRVYWGSNGEGDPTIATSTPSYNPDPSPNGVYFLRVSVEDLAGNLSPNVTLFIFRHDAMPPTDPTVFNDIVGSQNNVWQNSVNDPNFAWDTGEDLLSGIQGYKYYWGPDPNGTSPNMVSSPGFNPTSVDTGIWYLRISTVDWVGNSTSWFTGYTLKFDDIKPEATALSVDTSGYVSFNVSWLDGFDRGGSGLSGYDVRVREGVNDWTDWITNTTSTNAVYTGEHDHVYSIEVAARDRAGNIESFSGSAETVTVIDTLTTDIKPPDPPIGLIAGGDNPSPWQNTPQFELNWTNPQDENGIKKGYYKLNTIPFSNSDYMDILTGGPPNLISATAQGGQDLFLWLEDNRGNVNFQNYASVKLRWDGTKPINSKASSPDTTVFETFTVSWTGASDNGGSGLSGRFDTYVREDQSAWSIWFTDSLCSNAEYTGKQGHTYYFESLARDNAINIEQFTGFAECSTFIATRMTVSLSSIQGEFSDNIEFNYDVYNYDSSLTDIFCEYKLSSDLPWKPATIIGNVLGIPPHDYQGTVVWDSYTDAPGVDLTSVRFKITPSDFIGTGLPDSTGAFHLDNNRIPSVHIYTIEDEQSEDISISYQLTDQEQDTLSILCEFLHPDGQSWLTATTTGNLTDLTDYYSFINWHSATDLPDASQYLKFRIRPFDNDVGISDTIDIFIDNVGAPDILSISEITGEKQGDITINYVLSDNEGDNVNLICKYSEESGKPNTWKLASVSGAVTNISPSNYAGSLIWKSATDLPGIDKTTIRFQITANDGNSGFPMETDDFHLDNNLVPSVQISPISSTQSGSIFFPVIIQDAEKDTIEIIGRCQLEGVPWKWITFSGNTQFPSSEYVNMLEWKSVSDLGFGEFETVRIQVIPVDNDTGAVSVSNTFDVFNYAGDYTADIKINFDDLIVFAVAWSQQDLTKEIGPAEGTPPLLVPKPDNIIDFEDLMVLVQQWNWSYDNENSLSPGGIITTNSSNNLKRDEVFLKTQVGNNKTIRHLWEKESVICDQLIQPLPINEHLVKLSQSNNDLWSNEFGDKLFFILDSSAAVLGLQLQLDYDPEVFTVSEIENYLLHDQHGFTFKNTNPKRGEFTVSTVILDKKEELDHNIDSLLHFKLNPIKELQTSLIYRWKVFNADAGVITQGSNETKLTIHHSIPKQYALYQNFPNPFNSSTTIRYQLPVDSKVKLEIFNILGERIATLLDQSQKAGYYIQKWDISQSAYGVATGIYIVRFVAKNYNKSPFVDHKKVIVLK
ncbi:MAG: hypothetical protein AMS23_08880 [Bacteroides sp. SM1_62]|nr:MAG: hypothetical protein AMS23_08880 [Bacteroides sp. SM1_62]